MLRIFEEKEVLESFFSPSVHNAVITINYRDMGKKKYHEVATSSVFILLIHKLDRK